MLNSWWQIITIKKKPFFIFQVFKGGDEIIAPQMGTCDKISRILSFKRHVKNQQEVKSQQSFKNDKVFLNPKLSE